MKDDHEALRMTTQWLWDNMQGNREEGESEWCVVLLEGFLISGWWQW